MGLGDFVSGLFGSKDNYQANAPELNSADYQAQYGAGGSVARQNQLSQLGQQGANYSNTGAMQGAQAQALGLDMAAAQGNAPSVAQAQLQQGLAQSQAQAAAQAASARGGGANLAAAQNQAANTQAAQSAQANNQAAQLRAQEMATARGQVGDLATQGLGQQIGMSQFNANLQQGYENQANQVAAGQLGANEQFEAQNSANQLAADQINANVASGNASMNQQGGMAVLGIGSAAAGAAASALSDPQTKVAIQPEGGAFALGSEPPVLVVDSSRGMSAQDNRRAMPSTVPIVMDAGPQPIAPSGDVMMIKGPAPSIKAQKGAGKAIQKALAGPQGQQGQQTPFQAGQQIGDSFGSLGTKIGRIALGKSADEEPTVSSPPGAKMGVASEGAKPGGGDYFNPMTYVASGGNPQGEAALAARDAHTANFAQMGEGMGNWFNASNAQPWSPESSAAQANLSHFMGMQSGSAGMPKGGISSDPHSKAQARAEGAADALKAQADAMQADMDSHRNGFEWMGAQPVAVQDPDDDHLADVISGGQSDPFRNLQYARPGGSTAVDAQMDVQHPTSFLYKDAAENGGERRHGVMTTDVKQGPAGRDLVKQGPKGEVISIPSATSALMAQTGRLHERQTATEQKLASLLGEEPPSSPPPSALVYPAGVPVLNPTLERQDPAVYSVYDNGTKLASLSSDPKAKEAARAEGMQVNAAQMTHLLNAADAAKKYGLSADETREAMTTAMQKGDREATRGVTDEAATKYDLPKPPPPPLPDEQADRVARQLAAYNAQSDASLRAAAQGRPVAAPMVVADAVPQGGYALGTSGGFTGIAKGQHRDGRPHPSPFTSGSNPQPKQNAANGIVELLPPGVAMLSREGVQDQEERERAMGLRPVAQPIYASAFRGGR